MRISFRNCTAESLSKARASSHSPSCCCYCFMIVWGSILHHDSLHLGPKTVTKRLWRSFGLHKAWPFNVAIWSGVVIVVTLRHGVNWSCNAQEISTLTFSPHQNPFEIECILFFYFLRSHSPMSTTYTIMTYHQWGFMYSLHIAGQQTPGLCPATVTESPQNNK